MQACPAVPCLNGGLCNSDGAGGYTCSCLTGYSGTNCETGTFEYTAMLEF